MAEIESECYVVNIFRIAILGFNIILHHLSCSKNVNSSGKTFHFGKLFSEKSSKLCCFEAKINT